MKLLEQKDPRTSDVVYSLVIEDADLFALMMIPDHMEMVRFFKQCENTGCISGKLLGLASVAKRLEEIHADNQCQSNESPDQK
jgi:hypothetical protein